MDQDLRKTFKDKRIKAFTDRDGMITFLEDNGNMPIEDFVKKVKFILGDDLEFSIVVEVTSEMANPLRYASSSSQEIVKSTNPEVSELPSVVNDYNELINEFRTAGINTNGPHSFGIAAGIDSLTSMNMCLYLPKELIESKNKFGVLAITPQTVAAAYSVITLSKWLSRDEASIIQDQMPTLICAIYVIIRHQLYKGYFVGKTDVAMMVESTAAFRAAKDHLGIVGNLSNILTQGNLQDGLTLAMSTKVNYYATNHHTGSPVISNFARKVAAMICYRNEADEIKPEFVKCLHSIGHGIDTRSSLNYMVSVCRNHTKIATIGATILSDSVIPFTPDLSEDIRLRMNGLPAGVKWVSACNTVITEVARSLYALAVDAIVVQQAESLPIHLRNINNDPLSYHSGSAYLTNGERVNKLVTDNEIISFCSTYISIVRSGLNEAKSVTKANIDVVASGKIMSIRKLLTTGLNLERLEKALSNTFTISSNPFASGSYSDQAADLSELLIEYERVKESPEVILR